MKHLFLTPQHSRNHNGSVAKVAPHLPNRKLHLRNLMWHKNLLNSYLNKRVSYGLLTSRCSRNTQI